MSPSNSGGLERAGVACRFDPPGHDVEIGLVAAASNGALPLRGRDKEVHLVEQLERLALGEVFRFADPAGDQDLYIQHAQIRDAAGEPGFNLPFPHGIRLDVAELETQRNILGASSKQLGDRADADRSEFLRRAIAN
jgi:hypothetical protein